MNEQEMQAQFMQWLAKKTGVKTEQELQQVLSKLQSNPESMKQAIEAFQAETAGSTPTMKEGGKFSYVECLKKGGPIDCGCVNKGQKGTKITSQANAGAIKSPKYPALKFNVGSFTEKEVKNMPRWETATTPMRTHKEGGTLMADKGVRIQRREERQDKRAERQIGRKNERLVHDYNKDTPTEGSVSRNRNQFDEGAETLQKARQPLDRGDAKGSFIPPLATSNPKMEPANFPSLKNREDNQGVDNTAIAQRQPVAKSITLPPRQLSSMPQSPAVSANNPFGTGVVLPTVTAFAPRVKRPIGGTSAPAVSQIPAVRKVTALNEEFPKRQLTPEEITRNLQPIWTNKTAGVPVSTAMAITPKSTGATKNLGTPSLPNQRQSAINVWAQNYAKSKAIGDPMGMRHWQDLLETAGGER